MGSGENGPGVVEPGELASGQVFLWWNLAGLVWLRRLGGCDRVTDGLA
jgi:hypothetical protein